MSKRLSISALVSLCVATACGSDASEPPANRPTLTIVSGENVTDSATAILPAPLVVELRDERGRSVVGQVVEFKRAAVGGSVAFLGIITEQNGFANNATETTDAGGRASIRIQLGAELGETGIEVSVPDLSLVDTAFYRIVPGQPSQFGLAPLDTGLFVGGSLSLRATTYDRWQHPVAGTVAYEVIDGSVSVDDNGVVTATEIGVAHVRATLGDATQVVTVAVVPDGAVVMGTQHNGVVIMNLDGSLYRSINPDVGWYPTWSPSGSEAVYELDGRLVIQSIAGGAPRPLVSPDTTKGAHSLPSFTRDGQYIYFTTSASGEPQETWRANSDGSGLRRISPRPPTMDEVHPSPSPSGDRLAFNSGGIATIRVRDLATGVTSGSYGSGQMPAWSPLDDRIAFTEEVPPGSDRAIMLVNADGSDLRRLTAEGEYYHLRVNWSPDANWIAALHGSNQLHLIEVETGRVIPIPYAGAIISAAWRPNGIIME